ncbi:hypothetical protein TSUD_321410 [Trifolium subterraneum]|uniref:Uncharacterized protein n=1 Tax=Trifolium subterraneum TaxID=3900 RepID=A0A2Z6NQV2_TRISU|nr:hypothetical protein TSUD_321410 [Trifolium subterraneum]
MEFRPENSYNRSHLLPLALDTSTPIGSANREKEKEVGAMASNPFQIRQCKQIRRHNGPFQIQRDLTLQQLLP